MDAEQELRKPRSRRQKLRYSQPASKFRQEIQQRAAAPARQAKIECPTPGPGQARIREKAARPLPASSPRRKPCQVTRRRWTRSSAKLEALRNARDDGRRRNDEHDATSAAVAATVAAATNSFAPPISPRPAPAGHFVRKFGQSDRDQIEASHTEANVPQVLVVVERLLGEARPAHVVANAR